MKINSTEIGQEPIALIGVGCRFPGNVKDPQAFWQMLLKGVDAVSEIPPQRWDMHRYYHPNPAQPGKAYARHGAFLEQVDLFDAAFFGISASEASRMDPQQRFLLEISWEALEDAGLPFPQLAGSATGVFMGICTNEYRDVLGQTPMTCNHYTNAGSAGSIAANRLSYFFDWHGPSISVDTACSSALIAVHLACQSIWQGECSMALAGGVSLLLDPRTSIGFSKAHMLSPTGRCHAFDARADGYVRGEGAGVVLLKPLCQAQAASDPIYAVIRATGVNQDGRTPNLHFPGQQAQEALLREVYTQAGIDPAQVHYIEAHGTGTIVGDQVESQALGTIFAAGHSAEAPLRIGSVKTNLGHLEGASGMPSLIKTLLLLKHRQIPANLHFQQPNPHIPFDTLHLKVQQQVETIPETVEPFIAGINSFGFGGTNAHIVLQAYNSPTSTLAPSTDSEQEAQLLPLSARSPQALRAVAQAYQQLLQEETAPSLRDLCFTTSRRRTHHPERLALVASSCAEMCKQLATFLRNTEGTEQATSHKSLPVTQKMVFVFSGNGPQWWGMGRALLQQHSLVRAIVERCDHYWRPLAGWSLLEELLADEASSRMEQTEVAQPALFAIQIALAELWQSWGIEPQTVIGHSVGEIAAAYVAGILSFEDALAVVYHRSRLQSLTEGQGTMVAVGISASQAEKLIAPFLPRVALASINTPQSVTLSGEKTLLDQIIEPLLQKNIFCRFLRLNYAFHSAQMDVLKEDLLTALQHLKPQMAQITFLSTVTGHEIAGPECNAHYWWHNVRLPVQFANGIQGLLDQGETTFLEIGPHPVLSPYVLECLREQQGVIWPSLRRGGADLHQLLLTLGALYTRGYALHWEQIVPQGAFVQVPLYPWQRERYWPNASISGASHQSLAVHPLLGYRLKTPQPTWESTLDAPDLSYLFDHQIDDLTLFPMTGYCEMFLAVAVQAGTEGCLTLEQVKIHNPLFLYQEQPASLHTSLVSGDITVQAQGYEQENWTICATGHMTRLPAAKQATINLAELRARCPSEMNVSDFYTACYQQGFQYGPAFQLVQQVFVGNREALGRICLPVSSEQPLTNYTLHPALLDSCIQILFATLLTQEAAEAEQVAYLPVGLKRLHFTGQPITTSSLYSHAHLVRCGVRTITANYCIYDEEGTLLVELTELCSQAKAQTHRNTTDIADTVLYEERWYPSPLHPKRGGLPTPSTLWADAQALLAQVHTDLPLTRLYQQTLPHMHQLCVTSLLSTFRQLGWNLHAKEVFTIHEQCVQVGILPCYETLIKAWCLLLAEEGILLAEGTGWRVVTLPEIPEPMELLRAQLQQHPDHHLASLLLTNCITHLAAVLRGEINPRTLLFSGNDLSMLEQFYTNDLCIRHSNRLLQTSFKQLINHLPTDRHLRILEVGAGTGGTTSYLLPLLPPHRTTYVFTDISEFFLQHAQRKYHAYPFVEYRLLNLEQEPGEQGFAREDFDLVIASNVVHATSCLRNSLAHIHDLLAPQGLLYLVETTNQLSVMDLLVFGLLDEFWAFQDHDVRPTLPLLSVAAWQETLQHNGFSDSVVLDPEQATNRPEQTVFLTQRTLASQNTATDALADTAHQVWLVLADEMGVAEQLRARLPDQSLIIMRQGTRYQRLDARHYIVRPHHEQDLWLVLAMLSQEGLIPDQVIYLWGLLALSEHELDSAVLSERVQRSCLSLVTLVQTMLQALASPLPRLWVVTHGVQNGVPHAGNISLAQEMPAQIALAPLYGLTRVIINEHPELQPTVIDLSTLTGSSSQTSHLTEETEALIEEIHAQTSVSEVQLRGSQRFLNRIERAPLIQQLWTQDVQKRPDLSYRLTLETPGLLSRLALQTVNKRQPGPGEVAVEVVAAGLNFKDVAIAMGLITPDAIADSLGDYILGLECAGRIAALGAGVTNWQIGDEVIALGGACFSPWLVTEARGLVRKPANTTMEAAAGIICVFLTAYYALHELAHIRAGERVLIHGAAGGVGLAALQIVQHAGGEVIATAGTPEKRAYLHALGVRNILDSRSLAFADEVMQLTNGVGVDIVLNSVAGEVAARSLGVLRSFGRFLEIGKRDFQENAKLGLQPFERCLSYFSIDLARLQQDAPDLMQSMLQTLAAHFDQGHYMPLPYHLYTLDQVEDAFRFMQQSRQIGKIVIQFQQQCVPVRSRFASTPWCLQEDGSYLITGGVGGFGLATASYLAERGARHLILASRRGAPTEEDAATIAHLRQAGIQVHLACTDVTCEDEVAALFAQIASHMPPLRGIIHAAMVLDDRPVVQLDEASWQRAVAPKMLGAWNLHRYSLALPLDFFVLYSSVSASLGNLGQGNYVAGNAFLEALARYRRAHGLVALAINWGALSEVGYVAQNTTVRVHLDRTGVQMMGPSQALEILGMVVQTQRTQAGITYCNWNALTEFFSSPAVNGRWKNLLSQTQAQGNSSDVAQDDFCSLLAAMTPEERQSTVRERLQQSLQQVLGVTMSLGKQERALKDLGLDSLTAMELHNSLKRNMGVDLPIMQLLQFQNLADLATWISQYLTAYSSDRQRGKVSANRIHEQFVPVLASREGR